MCGISVLAPSQADPLRAPQRETPATGVVEWFGDEASPIGRQMKTTPFGTILETARTRYGAAALEARLPTPKTTAELTATPDDRFLSQMSLRIFRAGLKHSVVDAKWPLRKCFTASTRERCG